MIAELGLAVLWMAAALAVLQLVAGALALRPAGAQLAGMVRPVAVMQAVLVLGAFAALVWLFVTTDLSVKLVAENSHSAKPLIFKIAGTWGNHEGSMLLWVTIMAMAGAFVALIERRLEEPTLIATLAGQAFISLGFYAFLLIASNPFARLTEAPDDGQGLNPLLQDIGLAFHPPTLYVGYVGLSIAFSFAVGALVTRNVGPAFARAMRPWVLGAWIFLTLGITAGSYWAYYTLGWGGWWFWDPVENASFMPWLAVTALLHSALVMEKRDALKIWTVLLAILAFSLSLLGTFLVRSGVLTSVHAFASDPTRGVFILLILAFFVGGGLTFFAVRAGTLTPGGLFAPISREGALVLNNLLLTAAAATVLTGTLYPLALEALTGEKISVGAPFFTMTFGPLMVPLLIAVPFGPLLAWKRGDLYAACQRLAFALLAVFMIMVIGLALSGTARALSLFGIALAAWLIVGALSDVAFRIKFARVPLAESARRARHLPRSAFGVMLAHAGLGITVLGIVASSTWNAELIKSMKPGQTVEIAGRAVTMDGFLPISGGTYTGTAVRFTVRSGGAAIATLKPEKRFYSVQATPTTETALATFGFSQLYVALGDIGSDGTTVVRLYFKSLVTLIWLGAVVMALGGALSLSDRRLRVGAPKPARGAIAVPAQ